jgi:hypothetical protein
LPEGGSGHTEQIHGTNRSARPYKVQFHGVAPPTGHEAKKKGRIEMEEITKMSGKAKRRAMSMLSMAAVDCENGNLFEAIRGAEIVAEVMRVHLGQVRFEQQLAASRINHPKGE